MLSTVSMPACKSQSLNTDNRISDFGVKARQFLDDHNEKMMAARKVNGFSDTRTPACPKSNGIVKKKTKEGYTREIIPDECEFGSDDINMNSLKVERENGGVIELESSCKAYVRASDDSQQENNHGEYRRIDDSDFTDSDVGGDNFNTPAATVIASSIITVPVITAECTALLCEDEFFTSSENESYEGGATSCQEVKIVNKEPGEELHSDDISSDASSEREMPTNRWNIAEADDEEKDGDSNSDKDAYQGGETVTASAERENENCGGQVPSGNKYAENEDGNGISGLNDLNKGNNTSKDAAVDGNDQNGENRVDVNAVTFELSVMAIQVEDEKTESKRDCSEDDWPKDSVKNFGDENTQENSESSCSVRGPATEKSEKKFSVEEALEKTRNKSNNFIIVRGITGPNKGHIGRTERFRPYSGQSPAMAQNQVRMSGMQQQIGESRNMAYEAANMAYEGVRHYSRGIDNHVMYATDQPADTFDISQVPQNLTELAATDVLNLFAKIDETHPTSITPVPPEVNFNQPQDINTVFPSVSYQPTEHHQQQQQQQPLLHQQQTQPQSRMTNVGHGSVGIVTEHPSQSTVIPINIENILSPQNVSVSISTASQPGSPYDSTDPNDSNKSNVSSCGSPFSPTSEVSQPSPYSESDMSMHSPAPSTPGSSVSTHTALSNNHLDSGYSTPSPDPGPGSNNMTLSCQQRLPYQHPPPLQGPTGFTEPSLLPNQNQPNMQWVDNQTVHPPLQTHQIGNTNQPMHPPPDAVWIGNRMFVPMQYPQQITVAPASAPNVPYPQYPTIQNEPQHNQGFSDLWNQVQNASLDVVLSKDEDGDTSLHIAIAQGEETLSKALICRLARDHKAALDAQDNHGQTPLHLASVTHSLEVVSYLILNGANVTKCNHHGSSILHCAAERGFEQVILTVGQAITSFNNNCRPSERIVFEMNFRDSEGLNTLHVAVINHKTQKRVFVDNQSSDIMVDNTETIKILCEMGASPSCQDGKAGKTALHYAAERGESEIMTLLLSLVDDPSELVNTGMFNGNTALHLVVGSNRSQDEIIELMEILFRHGADPGIQNSEGDKAVAYAQRQHKKVQRKLKKGQ
ncbi:NF-kappa-B inhibitor zeta-like [Ptychodera flava]|uniref:NF-kappa-B inhibitor zeta-like n=1 Tax=Ptychodera flava TaxID=63121 RepID=UPI003969BE00